jgi:hypothetical protein
MVNSRAPWLAERALHKIPASSQYIDLARRHMIQLMSEKIGDGGSVVQSSLGQVSSVESTGGSWKLKMQWSMSDTREVWASIIFANSSSGTSRGVSHGVRVDQPG